MFSRFFVNENVSWLANFSNAACPLPQLILLEWHDLDIARNPKGKEVFHFGASTSDLRGWLRCTEIKIHGKAVHNTLNFGTIAFLSSCSMVWFNYIELLILTRCKGNK